MTANKELTKIPSPKSGTDTVPEMGSYVATALQFLGGAVALDRLREHLSSQVIAALMAIEDQKLFELYGFKTFKAFLEGSSLSGFSKSGYYRLRDLYLKEGPEQYDLFTEWRIPISTRQLLTDGDVTVKGSELIVGDKHIAIGDNPKVIKQVIERLVKEKIAATDDAEDKRQKLGAVTEKYDRLRKAIDEAEEKPPYVRAYLATVEILLTFINEVQDLPGDMKAERAPGDLDHISELMEQLYRAYGEAFPFRRKR